MIDHVEMLRQFNRRWTQSMGLLERALLDTSFSLPEARLLYELGQQSEWERLDLRQQLGLDDSYLTRLLDALLADELIELAPSKQDGRRKTVSLTGKGKREFKNLDRRSRAAMSRIVDPMTAGQKRTFSEALAILPLMISESQVTSSTLKVRELQSGDLGWVVQRHGENYTDQFGWNMDFEGLVAKIVADYYATRDPARDNAWIAELDNARAGCVFCCAKDATTAQLRILLVEPWARGNGAGKLLVDTCIDFAKSAGYHSIVLWTNDVLSAARKIYEAAGFVLVDEEEHDSFGSTLVGQNWRLDL